MLRVTHLTQMRQHRREAPNPALTAGLGCAMLLSLALALSGILLALIYTDLAHDLPSIQGLPVKLEPPEGRLPQPTRLYDRTGEHLLLTLQNPAAAGSRYLDVLPPNLISATIAAADPGFWDHPGFLVEDLLRTSQPTLAQRLVSSYLLDEEPPSFRRSLRERLLAAQVTTVFGRPKLLEWYLNNADFGRLATGVDAAAHVYFGKPAEQLGLAEAALLASVAQAPALNPHDAPQAALEGKDRLLQAMADQGWISRSAADQASQEKLIFSPPSPQADNPAPLLTDLALRQLAERFGLRRLEQGGLNILTTLDYELQAQAACAASTQLARLEGSTTELPENETQACLAARLLPTLPGTGTSSGNAPLPDLFANTAILDPSSGQVLALAGESRTFPAGQAGAFQQPRPVLVQRSPGTLVTPFIYLAAFARGLSPGSLAWDIPSGNVEVDAQNQDGQFHGPLRVRQALANDFLIPASQALGQVGVETAWRTAQQFGLTTLELPGQDFRTPLGWPGQVNLLQAIQAFAVLANQGVMAGQAAPNSGDNNGNGTLDPISVLRVEDASGQVIWDGSQSRKRAVVSPQLAYLLTDALSDEIVRWPSLGHPNPLEIGRPAAAKIGRTPPGQGSWSVGFTPQLVVGAWIGPANPASAVSGDAQPQTPIVAKASAGLWHAVAQYASRDLPALSWSTPAAISRVQVCDPSNMLPTPHCPAVVEEIFLAGSEPTQADNLFRPLLINRENGRLATIFTPGELVEERVYLNYPPEAVEWAKQSGYPLPPDSYDLITTDAQTPPAAQISSPAMFSVVHGLVPILGKLQKDQLDLLQIQVGKGLNPTEWYQVGQDIPGNEFHGQELGVWDTTGLSGLYAIQLLGVDKDQRIQRHTIQVTVDNQAPSVKVAFPSQGEQLSGEAFTIQINASDDMELQKVEVFINDRPLANLSYPPYSLHWEAKPGQYTLRVVATDRAGNTAEDQVDFVVK